MPNHKIRVPIVAVGSQGWAQLEAERRARRRWHLMRALLLVLGIVTGTLLGVALAIVGCVGKAHAQPLAPVDGERARRLFERGRLYYEAGDYEAALKELTAAREAQPLPGLDFNLGCTLEKLGRRAEAYEAFRRYVASTPTPEDAAEVLARAEKLRALAVFTVIIPAEATVITPAKAPVRRVPLAPTLLAAGGALVFAASAGLLGSVTVDYHGLQMSCAPLCAESRWGSLPAREQAGYALLSIGAAAVVVDVVLWAIQIKKWRR